jgi:hypothetical protein
MGELWTPCHKEPMLTARDHPSSSPTPTAIPVERHHALAIDVCSVDTIGVAPARG